MEITVKTLPHNKQRYNTCGDYFSFCGGMMIRVSEMGNQDYELLVAVHEIIEAYLTQKRGIKEEDITKFDVEFKGEGEPGDDPQAPYRKEHFFATSIERLLAAELNVDWNKYDQAIQNL